MRPPLRLAPLALLALAAAGCPKDAPPATPPPATTAVAPPKGAGNNNAGGAPKATPKPFDRATARTPWKLCKVGDWATYRSESGTVKKIKFEITAVGDRSVTFTRSNADTGAALGDPIVLDLGEEESRYKDPMTYDALARDDKGNEIKPYKEKVTVAGKEVEALVIKRANPSNGSSTELWIAEEVVRPFNQCAIKSIRNGKLELELLDFGP